MGDQSQCPCKWGLVKAFPMWERRLKKGRDTTAPHPPKTKAYLRMRTLMEAGRNTHTHTHSLARLPTALMIGSRSKPIITVDTQLITNPKQLDLQQGTQDLGEGNTKSLGKESRGEVMSRERKREKLTPTQDECTNCNPKTPEESGG